MWGLQCVETRSTPVSVEIFISNQQCLPRDVSSLWKGTIPTDLRPSPTFCSKHATCVGNLQAVDVDQCGHDISGPQLWLCTRGHTLSISCGVLPDQDLQGFHKHLALGKRDQGWGVGMGGVQGCCGVKAIKRKKGNISLGKYFSINKKNSISEFLGYKGVVIFVYYFCK